jgi:hypothetical protein
LNIILIATDNILGDLSDTRLGNMKAIIANTIATVPKPIFVKGVTFLLRPDGFFVVAVFCKDEYNISNIIPIPTLSNPIVNNVIESSKIIIFTDRTRYCVTVKTIDSMRDILSHYLFAKRETTQVADL